MLISSATQKFSLGIRKHIRPKYTHH